MNNCIASTKTNSQIVRIDIKTHVQNKTKPNRNKKTVVFRLIKRESGNKNVAMPNVIDTFKSCKHYTYTIDLFEFNGIARRWQIR